MEQSGNLNLVSGVSIDAIPPAGLGTVSLSVEDYNTTFFSVTWDDDVGTALTQALHFEIGGAVESVPEPSSLLFVGSAVCGLLMRRRRK